MGPPLRHREARRPRSGSRRWQKCSAPPSELADLLLDPLGLRLVHLHRPPAIVGDALAGLADGGVAGPGIGPGRIGALRARLAVVVAHGDEPARVLHGGTRVAAPVSRMPGGDQAAGHPSPFAKRCVEKWPPENTAAT